MLHLILVFAAFFAAGGIGAAVMWWEMRADWDDGVTEGRRLAAHAHGQAAAELDRLWTAAERTIDTPDDDAETEQWIRALAADEPAPVLAELETDWARRVAAEIGTWHLEDGAA